MSLQQMKEMAIKAGFGDTVIKSLEKADVQIDDLPLSAEDIRVEFCGESLRTRRDLASFFEEDVSLGQNSDLIQEPFRTKTQKKKTLFQRFQEPSVCAGKHYRSDNICYPRGIAHPFPLPQDLKIFLKTSTRSSFCQKHAVYKRLIREIHLVIMGTLGRKASHTERLMVSVGLVKEYPILGCGYPPHSALNEAIRKRSNNQEQILRSLLKSNALASSVCHSRSVLNRGEGDQQIPCAPSSPDVATTDCPTTPSSEESPLQFKSRRSFIKDIDGKNRSTLVYAKFPQFCEPDAAFKEFALILSVKEDDLMKRCKKNWRLLVGHHGGSEIAAVRDVLWAACDGNAVALKHVICFAGRGDMNSTTKEKNQPFLLCTGTPNKPGSVSLVVDQKKIAELGRSGLKCVLMLLSTYYILDLEYPTAAKHLYDYLEDRIIS